MCGPLAQSVEQFPFKEWVASSNLAGLTNNQQNQSFKTLCRMKNALKKALYTDCAEGGVRLPI